MKFYTDKAVSKLSGVSVRALHHYDEIGLLKPAHVGENRYRYYGWEELLRLQQILIHRELDIPLSRIAAIIDAPGFDQIAALEGQRVKLHAEAERYAELVRTIDRTIEKLKGDRAMKDADLYRGISPEKQAEYEAWLVDKLGPGVKEHIDASKTSYAKMSDAERQTLQNSFHDVEAAWVEAMKRGVPADSPTLEPLHRRHCDWVAAMWGRACSPEAYAGLADLHLSHPDFVTRYEGMAEGFSDYHAASMKAWAARRAA